MEKRVFVVLGVKRNLLDGKTEKYIEETILLRIALAKYKTLASVRTFANSIKETAI